MATRFMKELHVNSTLKVARTTFSLSSILSLAITWRGKHIWVCYAECDIINAVQKDLETNKIAMTTYVARS